MVDARHTAKCSEERERGECSRCNGKTFSCCSSGVAHGIEVIGAVANLLGQLAHLGNTACIIRNRTERIYRQLHGSGGHHPGSRNSYTVQSCKVERSVNATGQNNNREHGRFHSDRKPTDDVGGVTCSRLTNDRKNRSFAHGSIILSDDTHQCTYHQAKYDRVKNIHTGKYHTANG